VRERFLHFSRGISANQGALRLQLSYAGDYFMVLFLRDRQFTSGAIVFPAAFGTLAEWRLLWNGEVRRSRAWVRVDGVFRRSVTSSDPAPIESLAPPATLKSERPALRAGRLNFRSQFAVPVSPCVERSAGPLGGPQIAKWQLLATFSALKTGRCQKNQQLSSVFRAISRHTRTQKHRGRALAVHSAYGNVQKLHAGVRGSVAGNQGKSGLTIFCGLQFFDHHLG
jgi:hypothetical protein